MVVFCDTHAHLDFEPFDADREAAIERASAIGLRFIINISIDLESSYKSLALARQYPGFIFSTIGIHPNYSQDSDETTFREIGKLAGNQEVVAIGEIGLDYYYDFAPRKVQRDLLAEQLNLAYNMKKPVVLHVREAQGEMISLLEERRGKLPGGVLHSYSGSAESARQYLEMGFYISFSGAVTFKNAEKVRRAALAVPLDRLLIETDSPYLSPVPHRGKRNTPALVRHVCDKLAELFEMVPEDMARITRDNALRLFCI